MRGRHPGRHQAGLQPDLQHHVADPQQVEDLASNAKAAGIEITLSGSNFNYIIQNYNDAASPANENKWAMEDFGGETNSTYPTRSGSSTPAGPARSATTATRPRTR